MGKRRVRDKTMKMGETFGLTIQSVQPSTYYHSPFIISPMGCSSLIGVKRMQKFLIDACTECYMNVEFGS